MINNVTLPSTSYNRYEALKESLKGDLLMVMETYAGHINPMIMIAKPELPLNQ